MSSRRVELPSAIFFNPQSKAASAQYLSNLKAYLCDNKELRPLTEAIKALPGTWKRVSSQGEKFASLSQGPLCTEALSDWITGAQDATSIANAMSACLALPLLTIIQSCQYFQFLQAKNIKHQELLETVEQGGGVQGYCAGLLPAVAIATSANEAELVDNTCRALRLALAIGAYADLGDEELSGGPTNIVVRLKYEGQGEKILEGFPGVSWLFYTERSNANFLIKAYISAVTDPKTISIVGPSGVLSQIKAYADSQGLLSQGMHIRGKVHNPENEEMVQELCSFCEQHGDIQYPALSDMKVAIRSNSTAERLCGKSLTREVIKTILSSRCEWYNLLKAVSSDLARSGHRAHLLLNFGIGDCLSPIPFHQHGLQISKLEARSLVDDSSGVSGSSGHSYPPNAVAVIGMACRFPGADNVEELWEALLSGKSMVKELPKERVDSLQCFRMSHDKTRSRKNLYGNYIDRPDSFDNDFFGISPREAVSMDPQQRLLLETAYHAIESSGKCCVDTRGDRVGVFIGASTVEYLANTSSHPPTAYTSMGTLRAFLCGRISHHFGWTGPAEVVDTACSSSLVALSRASKAIQNGECSMALAGGVNIISSMENYLDLGKAGFLSKTGQCKPFDKSADGYCRSEGVGIVVLKSLSQAVKHSDNILGVVAGIGTNQGGLSSSITVPHAPTQVKLYRDVLEQAGLASNQVSYVEAHGTGTQVGDPLEMASIREVFGGSDRTDQLSIGSIKGNIGHCETAAGIAGFIKALLLLQKRKIPRLASHATLNPSIPNLEQDKMTIASTVEPWNVPYRAVCVNSYGAAGGNAAAILCQAPQTQGKSVRYPPISSQSFPFMLSADSKDSLGAYANDLRDYLLKTDSKYIAADVAFTLAKRSNRHRFRWTTVESGVSGLIETLRKGIESTAFEVPKKRKSVVLAFAGQSRRFVGLKKSLYTYSPLLRSFIDQCDAQLTALGFSKIIPAIFETEPISDVQVLQCGIFALQYACARCWIESGLQVDAVIGHSLGELTALAVAGVLSLKDALNLVATRASLIASSWGNEKGAMLTMRGSATDVQEVISSLPGEPLGIACYNSDTSHVLVGPEKSIAEAEGYLQRTGRVGNFKPQRLDVSHGFHSKLTKDILNDLDRAAESLAFEDPSIAVECCTLEKQAKVGPKHISKHARNSVYFAHAVRRLEDRLGPCIWLEADMNSPIIPMAKRAIRAPDCHSFYPLRPDSEFDPLRPISNITADLWRKGIAVSFWDFHTSLDHGFEHVWLPPYHFRQTRHWLPNIDHTTETLEKLALEAGSQDSMGGQDAKAGPSPLVVRKPDQEQGPASENFAINTETARYTDVISGHAVLRRPLCPAAMYMECAFMAVHSPQRVLDSEGFSFENCSFEAPLGLDTTRLVSISITDEKNCAGWSFKVQSSPKENSRSRSLTHSRGKLGFKSKLEMLHYQRLISKRIQELSVDERLESLRGEKAYRLFSRIVNYSAIFRGISTFRVLDNEALAEIVIPDQSQTSENSIVSICDAVSLDIFLQVSGLLLNCHESCGDDEVFLAVGVDNVSASLACNFGPGRSWTVYTMFTALTDTSARGDVWVLWPDGTLAVTMMGVHFAKTPNVMLQKLLDSSNAKKSAKAVPNMAEPPKPSVIAKPRSGIDDDPTYGSSSSRDSHDSGQIPRDKMLSPENNSEEITALKKILASHVGLSHDRVADDCTVSEMGVDSLAAIELADEIAARFGEVISAPDLLRSDVQTLCTILAIESRLNRSPPTEPLRKNPTSFSFSQGSGQSAPKVEQEGLAQRTRLMELVSSHSGCPVATIEDKSRLDELGVDSLSKIELKSEIEAVFTTEIEDCDFSTKTTIATILVILGISSHLLVEPQQELEMSRRRKALSPKSGVKVFHEDEQTPFLTDPINILADCDLTFNDTATKHNFANYWTEVAPKHDELLLAYIAEAFRHLGTDLWKTKPGSAVTEVKYVPQHTKLMQRLWMILEALGIVSRSDGQAYRTSKTIPEVPSSDLVQQLIELFPAYACDAKLMAVTGSKLAACLAGEANPLSLLFGNPEAKGKLGDFYHYSPMFATLTEHLVNFVNKLLEVKGRGVFRILEAGAGFGGTTTALAEKLQGIDDVEYTFTDVSPTLVDQARRTFSKYPWMDFQVLDLEKDPSSSLLSKYDMIVATNVVHATSNLVRSISTLKALLRPGGFICLSEITQSIEWHNIVFGLLSGWWCFNDGRTYAIQSAQEWMRDFKRSEFSSVSYSDGYSAEARSQQLLIGSTRPPKVQPGGIRINSKLGQKCRVQTMVYKVVDDTPIEADVYFPSMPDGQAMPIGKLPWTVIVIVLEAYSYQALVIHGGGFMTLSKTAIRPAQIQHLLDKGVLPISIDYRLCPEVNLIDGPMTDARDALFWIHTKLPDIARGYGINLDLKNLAVIGWSTGGHLAMTTAWTTMDAGIEPPKAILNFYGPADFKALGMSALQPPDSHSSAVTASSFG